jgi:hypothetical protein
MFATRFNHMGTTGPSIFFILGMLFMTAQLMTTALMARADGDAKNNQQAHGIQVAKIQVTTTQTKSATWARDSGWKQNLPEIP